MQDCAAPTSHSFWRGLHHDSCPWFWALGSFKLDFQRTEPTKQRNGRRQRARRRRGGDSGDERPPGRDDSPENRREDESGAAELREDHDADRRAQGATRGRQHAHERTRDVRRSGRPRGQDDRLIGPTGGQFGCRGTTRQSQGRPNDTKGDEGLPADLRSTRRRPRSPAGRTTRRTTAKTQGRTQRPPEGDAPSPTPPETSRGPTKGRRRTYGRQGTTRRRVPPLRGQGRRRTSPGRGTGERSRRRARGPPSGRTKGT